ncbi:MAG: hypothetical protein EOM24_29835 [Chloroflexia bacterium]|nr:hypothetical protein [Chloroflexia bacterium]
MTRIPWCQPQPWRPSVQKFGNASIPQNEITHKRLRSVSFSALSTVYLVDAVCAASLHFGGLIASHLPGSSLRFAQALHHREVVMRGLVWMVVVVTCTLAFAHPPVGARPSSAPSQVFLPLIRSPYPNPDLAALAQAAEGLLYPSEIDAPLVPFVPSAHSGLSPDQVCLALADGAPIRLLNADDFLAAPARVEPWMSPEQRALAARFATLREVFRQRLANPVACRIGGFQADVFLLGISSTGQLIGLHTVVVET